MVRRDASRPGAPGAAPEERARPVPAGEEPGTGGDVRCKLRRGDGSEWTVTDLGLEADGLRVSAYRYVRQGHTASEARRETLTDELLTPRDRVWCHDRRGAVIWDLAHPGAGARSSTGATPGTESLRRTDSGTDALPGGRDGDGDVG